MGAYHGEMKLALQRKFGQGFISALTIISDGGFLVAGVLDGFLVLGTRQLSRTATQDEAHAGLVTALAAEPDGRRFVSGGRDGRVRLWTMAKNGKLKAGAGIDLGSPVLDLAWGSGPAPIAAALESGQVALWSPGARSFERLGVPGRAARSVAWFSDGDQFLVGGDDGAVSRWQLTLGRDREVLFTHHNAIRQARVSWCGRYLAFSSGDEKGGLYELSTGKLTRFGEPGEAVVSLAWHPGKPQLCGGTDRGSSFHFDVETGKLVRWAGMHLHPAEAAAYHPGGELAYSGGRDGRIVSMNPGQGAAGVLHAPPAQGYALSCAWAGAEQVAAGYSSGATALWSLGHDKLPRLLEKPHQKAVYGLAVSPDGRCVASGSVDCQVKVWDLSELRLVHDLPAHSRPVYGVSFSPDGRYLCTGSGDTFLVVYDLEEVKKRAKEEFGPEEFWHFAVRNRILNCVAWAPDGKRIAVGLSSHDVSILDVLGEGKVEKRAMLKRHEDSVSRVAWGPGGTFLVSVGYDKRVVVWDGASLAVRQDRVVEHDEPIQALAVHPSGEVIATGSWDGSIRLWRASDLQALGSQTRPHFSAVESLEFDRDGKRLCSASSDGTVAVWNVR